LTNTQTYLQLEKLNLRRDRSKPGVKNLIVVRKTEWDYIMIIKEKVIQAPDFWKEQHEI
jgi:hypothetical protein